VALNLRLVLVAAKAGVFDPSKFSLAVTSGSDRRTAGWALVRENHWAELTARDANLGVDAVVGVEFGPVGDVGVSDKPSSVVVDNAHHGHQSTYVHVIVNKKVKEFQKDCSSG
jgi:hypothetical protein